MSQLTSTGFILSYDTTTSSSHISKYNRSYVVSGSFKGPLRIRINIGREEKRIQNLKRNRSSECNPY